MLIVQHFGRYTDLLSCHQFDEKVDATHVLVEGEATARKVSLASLQNRLQSTSKSC